MTVANAAELWESLGCVPQHRIVQDPAPGTATEADVLRLNDHEDRLCELIDGTLVQKTSGYEESLIAVQVGYLLSTFVRSRKIGWVSGAGGMMQIMRRRVRIPDVGFVAAARFPGGNRPRGPIPEIAPDLAVEVISEGNTPKEMSIKLHEYFSAGTRLVWYIDPPTRTVQVFTSPDASTRLTESDTLTGGEVLPGFEVKVAELFDID